MRLFLLAAGALFACFGFIVEVQAHSFPPSSLDRRCFEFIVSPRKVVGCRGGSPNVEGRWWFSYLKIEKLMGFTKLPFHAF